MKDLVPVENNNHDLIYPLYAEHSPIGGKCPVCNTVADGIVFAYLNPEWPHKSENKFLRPDPGGMTLSPCNHQLQPEHGIGFAGWSRDNIFWLTRVRPSISDRRVTHPEELEE